MELPGFDLALLGVQRGGLAFQRAICCFCAVEAGLCLLAESLGALHFIRAGQTLGAGSGDGIPCATLLEVWLPQSGEFRLGFVPLLLGRRELWLERKALLGEFVGSKIDRRKFLISRLLACRTLPDCPIDSGGQLHRLTLGVFAGDGHLSGFRVGLRLHRCHRDVAAVITLGLSEHCL